MLDIRELFGLKGVFRHARYKPRISSRTCCIMGLMGLVWQLSLLLLVLLGPDLPLVLDGFPDVELEAVRDGD